MKRRPIPLLIASLGAFAGTADAGAPVVYGKINVSLQKLDMEQIGGGIVIAERDDWQLRSNASRIGVKGDYDISEGLKAVYKLEYEISVDTGTNSNSREFSARNIVGGFQGSWGTLLAGRHDTPLKLIQEKVDRFNDLQIADISNYLVGEYRRDNLVMYTSPSWGGFAVTAAFAPGEGATGPDGTTDDSIADTTSLALTYGAGTSLYVALAHEQNMAANGAAGSSDITRLVAEGTIGPVKIGALYQVAEQHDGQNTLSGVASSIGQFGGSFKEQNAWLLSGEWAITPNLVAKAQYGYSETTPLAAGTDDAEAALIAVGLDYKLDKNSRIFGYYARLETEGDDRFATGTPRDRTVGFGYELNF